MLPRVFTILLCVSLLIAAAAEPVRGQSLRYHLGDDPRWADPAFDDGSWPLAAGDEWPLPQFYSDGFVWVRFHAAIRAESGPSLGLRIGWPRFERAEDAFVNGMRVGSFGHAPPHAQVNIPEEVVFDVPAAAAVPNAGGAVIALRLWYPPGARSSARKRNSRQSKLLVTAGGDFDTSSIELADARTLAERQELDRLRDLLGEVPEIAFNLAICLVGICVLLLWRRTGSGQLFLSGVVLLSYAVYVLFFKLIEADLLRLTLRSYVVWSVVLCIPSMVITTEFIWRFHGLKGAGWKWAAWVSLLIFNIAALPRYLLWNPTPLVGWSVTTGISALHVFNAITFTANMWVVLIKRKNRLIACSMALIPLCSSIAVIPGMRKWDLFDAASGLAMACLAIALGMRAWQTWRTRDALEAEFEAAREVQERMVTPAGDVPGFQVESAYFPAAHVGGDFFFLRGETDGALLAVLGDVSGKGLRAALTVSAIMGALRTMPPLPTARILGDLNRGLAGQLGGGFVTCCALRVRRDGSATIANAGHLPPYRNGAEIGVEPGLPLGIDAGADYIETQFAVHESDRLTLLSDGVVEARSTAGELFGFERTRAMSGRSAEAIAEAAQRFGQEDDITVLTIVRLRAARESVQEQVAMVSPATA